jgi:protoheme IX farnesyltransferase
MAGPLYLGGALVLGVRFVYFALRLWISEGDGHAMPTFLYSIRYLMWLFGVLLADHYLMALF